MIPLPFASLNSFQFRVLFATLTCLCLIYVIWNGQSSPENEHLVAPVSFSNPFNYYGKAKPARADTNEDIAFCIATKDQSRDLPEFLIHHHYHHGIRRFYIMDDRSSPPLSSFTNYGIPRSALSFQYYDSKAQHENMQTHIYSECVRLYGPLHTWMAFIDADEFFETRNGETLQSFLKEFEHNETVGAVNVNWRIHSSSGILTRPDSVRQSFTTCVADPEDISTIPTGWKDNRLTKSIVKTSLFELPLSPHRFGTFNATRTVGENGDAIESFDGMRLPITRDRIALHHYTLKSREQFEEKLQNWKDKDWTYWDHIEGLPHTECKEMTKYEP
jgi:hypothetical protein